MSAPIAPRSITKRTIDAMMPGDTVWDADVKGFEVRCQRSARTCARIANRQRHITIGTHGSSWTPITARREALRLLGEVPRHEGPNHPR